MNLVYEVEADKAFDEVAGDVRKQAAEHGFRVLYVHDVQETLAEKGFERGPLKIVEICNSKFAHMALQKDMAVSLFMPCKINVYTEKGKTRVKAMRPSAIAEFMPRAGLEELAGEIDKAVVDIVDRAAARQ